MDKMVKLTDKWITKPLSNKKLKEFMCKYGSITCGLHQRLKTGLLCNKCRKAGVEGKQSP